MKKHCFLIAFITLIFSHTLCVAFETATDDSSKNQLNLGSSNLSQNYQNYIIFSEKPVKKIISSNNSIVYAYVMTTIDNKRDTIILESKNLGKAKLIVIVENETIEINVTVQENKTIVETNSNILNPISIDVPDNVNMLEEV